MNYRTTARFKVFGIGLSRTGTFSLGVALSYLGFKTAHFTHGGRLIDSRAIRECDALLDTPIACRYPELLRKYPTARFIYTVRDKASWLDSSERTILPTRIRRLISIRMRLYGTARFDRRLFAAAYDRWHSSVMRDFGSRGNFLVMNIVAGVGWGVLCPFLGKALPRDVPFPRGNVMQKEGDFDRFCEEFRR